MSCLKPGPQKRGDKSPELVEEPQEAGDPHTEQGKTGAEPENQSSASVKGGERSKGHTSEETEKKMKQEQINRTHNKNGKITGETRGIKRELCEVQCVNIPAHLTKWTHC